MQEAVQVHRLPEALSRGLQPRRPKRPTSLTDGGASPVLRAAAAEDRPLLRRRHVPLAAHQQRRAQRRRVAAGQLRVAAAGEPRAEAGDLAHEGEAERAGEGAGGDEAGDDGEGRPWPDLSDVSVEGHWQDRDIQRRSRRRRQEAEVIGKKGERFGGETGEE